MQMFVSTSHIILNTLCNNNWDLRENGPVTYDLGWLQKSRSGQY